MRRFELSDGKSNKFWEIDLDGTSFSVTFGKIGTSGQTQTKTFDNASKAQTEYDKLVKEKTKKGYTEVGAGDAPPKKAAPPKPVETPKAPAAIAPSEQKKIESKVTAGVDWSPEALREAAPRRGLDAIPLRAPDAKSAYAKLASAMKKATSTIDSGMHIEGANAALARRVLSAFSGEMKRPLELEVQAAAFALIGPKLAYNDSPREDELVELWCATEGVSFALRALDAAERIHVKAKNKEHTYDLEKLAIVEGETTIEQSAWWRARTYDSWRALRRGVLAAGDAARPALEKEASAILEAPGGRTPSALNAFRGAFALGFERYDWVAADAPADSRPAAWLHARGLLAPTVEDAMKALEGTAGPHSVWYLIQNLEPIRWDFLARFGAAAGPALVPILTQGATSGADRLRSIAEVLAHVASDDVARFFLSQLTSKELRAIASEYLRSHPPVSAAILADAAAKKGPLADAARSVLKPFVAANDPAITTARTTLGPAAIAVLDALALDAAPKVEAAPEELPPVLRAPPWKEKRKTQAPKELSLVVPSWDEKIAWRAGERVKRGKETERGMTPVKEKVGDHLAAIEKTNADGLATTKPSYARQNASIFLRLPEKELLAVLPEAKLEHFGWNYYDVADALVARYELAVLEPLLRFAEREPSHVVRAVERVDSPRVAPLMAEAFYRLKTFRDVAGDWLAAFPGAATVGLLPLAVGKEKRPRAIAENALRFSASRGHRDAMLAAANACGDGAHDALAEILDFDPLHALPAKIPNLPGWWSAGAFSRPLLRGREKAIPLAAVDTLGTSLALSTLEDPYAGVLQVKEACDPRSLADFAWDLFQAWLVAGASSKEAWAFQALGHFGDDECARRLTPLVRAWPGEAAHARAVVGLDVLARIGTDVALMHLHGIAQKLKFKGLQEKAREKIDEIAEARGLTAEELGDRLVPDLGLDDDGSLRLDFGPRAFRVRFDETLKPFVLDDEGKRIPDLPKAKVSDDEEKAKLATETWKALKKDAKTIAQAQLLRLELAMCSERRWDEDVFRPFLLEHPLLVHLVRRLVWGAYDPKSGALRTTFRVAEDSSFADQTDGPLSLPEGSSIGIVHRLALDDRTAAAWGQVLSDYELIQPFEQLARSVIRPDEAEAKATALTRVKGIKVPTGKVLGLDAHGWRRGPPQDGGVVCWYEKPIAGGLVVSMDLDPGIFTGMVSEAPEQTLGEVTLTKDGYEKSGATFGELGAIVFSELARDLDSLRG